MLDTFFSCFTIYFYVFKFTVYSSNLVLCIHLAINSLLLFNNLSGHLCIRICIFSSEHKLHLASKLFGVFDFFKIDHSISGVNPLFFKHQNCFDSAVWCFRSTNITDKKTYIGLASTKWKERYSNHKFTFSHEHLWFFLKDIYIYIYILSRGLPLRKEK